MRGQILIASADAELRSDLAAGCRALGHSVREAGSAESAARPPVDPLVGDSPALARLRDQVSRIASTDRTTVLVTGESGTGKELVARSIHERSRRAAGPFVALNCASLGEGLLESELFGYEPGAFTGASPRGREGLLAAAAGGTLLLDEIGELAPALQAKLLRVLQERTYRRVGGREDLELAARVVASTHRDLVRMVEEGTFREDLFYRLNVLSVRVPALRERTGDVRLLAEHFLRQAALERPSGPASLSAAALERLDRHPWPGNVREIANTILRAALLAPGARVEAEDLELERRSAAGGPGPCAPADSLPLGDRSLKSVEAALVRQVLAESGGNRSRAARVLGIDRTTLYKKLRDYGIEPLAQAV